MSFQPQDDEMMVMIGNVRRSRRGMLLLSGAGALAFTFGTAIAAPAQAQTMFPGRFRVMHGAPDLGNIEVLFNDNKLLDDFAYGQASDWIDVDPGLVRITIKRDRLFINDTVYDLALPVIADERTELIISDPLVIPAPIDRAPVPEDMGRARAIHASIDTPVVDLAIEGGGVILLGLAYGQLSVPFEAPAGMYDLEVRVHGTSDVLTQVPQVPLGAGTITDLVLYGKPGDGNAPLTLGILTDTVRVLPAATPEATPTG
jgi:hypothetical protein